MPRKISFLCTRQLVMNGKCPRTTQLKKGQPTYAKEDLTRVCKMRKYQNRNGRGWHMRSRCRNVPIVKRKTALRKHSGLSLWTKAVSAARKRLGISGFTPVKRGTQLYELASKYYKAAKHNRATKKGGGASRQSRG